jgi:urea transport system permease protein
MLGVNFEADRERSPWNAHFWLAFGAVTVALIAVVPLLNLALPPGSPLAIPDYLVPLLGKYLCFAMLALSLDLVWGYAGILSLGHGAFFALGGYAMGMYLMRQIGTRGVYLSIITQAMTYALWLAFFRNDMGFGGNNGMTDFKDLLGFNLQLPGTRLGLYIASAVGLVSAYLLCRFITTSKLGRVLLALRDAESRVRFLGYSVTGAKLFVFTVSAVLAGIAGALYVPQAGIINPSEFSPANSIEIAIWVSVGGRGTLAGAALGAVLVNLAKSWLTGVAPEIWLFFLGGLFVMSTLVFPNGIVGVAGQLRALAARRRIGPAPLPVDEPAAAKEQA